MSRKRASETPVVVAPKPASRLRVRIKRFHAVAKWTWNANDDVCGICQSAFEGVAPGVKYPGDECPVVWGKCGHAFHLVSKKMYFALPLSKNACLSLIRMFFSCCSNVYLPGSTIAEIPVQSVVVNGSLEVMREQAVKVKQPDI